MTPISLSPGDLAVAALLIVVDAALSLWLGLGMHRRILVAALRMVIQLVLVGFVLRAAFAVSSPALTLGLVVVMAAIAAREVGARPEQRLARGGNFAIAALAVGGVTTATVLLALTTAIRPEPWWTPRTAIPLAGIVLGSVLNAASLALDAVLAGAVRERAAIEAQLALGAAYRQAVGPLVRDAIRRGMVPVLNQMSAAGLVTLPGIMTGQILAGLDPIEAVKYQILLMFLLGGASGLAAAAAAMLASWRLTDNRQRLRLERLAR